MAHFLECYVWVKIDTVRRYNLIPVISVHSSKQRIAKINNMRIYLGYVIIIFKSFAESYRFC